MVRFRRFRPPRYLLKQFEEREEDFLGYFNSLSSQSDLATIKDKDSFEFVLQKSFSSDESLRFWVANVDEDTIDKFFESATVQNILERNKGRRIIASPTIKERKITRQRILQTIKEQREVIPVSKKRFVKGFVRGLPVRAVPVIVKVMGRPQRRLRDISTGRFASIKQK